MLNGIRDPVDRELVLVDFKPVKDSRIGELSARFDIVIGRTPSDRPDRERPSREPRVTLIEYHEAHEGHKKQTNNPKWISRAKQRNTDFR